MAEATTIPALFFYPLGMMRRMWLTFVLAVVLSAVEIERTRRISEPVPIVMTIDRPPMRPFRARPYRAHYRHISSHTR